MLHTLRVLHTLMIVVLVVAPGGCRGSCSPHDSEPTVLSVYAAASMGPFLHRAARRFEAEHPGVEVQIELSGSQVAVRKSSPPFSGGDVLVSADANLIDDMMADGRASFNIRFAANALVLAYSPTSKFAKPFSAGEPWQKVLLFEELVFGIADPALAPLGYRTMMALQLNDMWAPKSLRVGSQIASRIKPRWQRPDATTLIAPLLSGEFDAVFVYRSLARAHGVPFVELGPWLDLSDSAKGDWYEHATWRLATSVGNATRVVKGSPTVYGLTVLPDRTNETMGLRFVAWLLSKPGRRVAATNDLPLFEPGAIRSRGEVPPALTALLGGQA